MLEPQEKAVFDGMVLQLRADDPRFARRMTRLAKPRHRVRLAAAILLWTLALLSILYGGWTGLIVAFVATTYGAHLYARRRPPQPQPPWWTATRGHRPESV
ncbi:MAG: DUF3040 domain-containing protein [Jiangellaceae bacterium]